jgi:hypothetical protein
VENILFILSSQMSVDQVFSSFNLQNAVLIVLELIKLLVNMALEMFDNFSTLTTTIPLDFQLQIILSDAFSLDSVK